MSAREAALRAALETPQTQEPKMTTINVPDIDGPTAQLCWTQKLDPPGAMTRCDRRKGHYGPHSWERSAAPAPQETPPWCPKCGSGETRWLLYCDGCKNDSSAAHVAASREPQPTEPTPQSGREIDLLFLENVSDPWDFKR